MSEVIAIFNEWPIIVQGALGSGLFWLILILGQFVFNKISSLSSSLSKKRKLYKLRIERIKLWSLSEESDIKKTYLITNLIFLCINDIIKALVFFVLAWWFYSVSQVLGIIGYIFSLYFLFEAKHYVQDSPDIPDVKDQIIAIESQIESLNKKLNK